MEFLLSRARLQLALLLTSFVFHALDMNFKFRYPHDECESAGALESLPRRCV